MKGPKKRRIVVPKSVPFSLRGDYRELLATRGKPQAEAFIRDAAERMTAEDWRKEEEAREARKEARRRDHIEPVPHAAARERLFPGSLLDTAFPKPTWAPWTKPTPAFPIDDFIERAINGEGKFKLLSREALRLVGIECPYLTARSWFDMAAEIAEGAAPFEQDIVARDGHLRQKSIEAKAAKDAVASFLSGVSPYDFAPVTRRGHARSDHGAINRGLSEARAAIEACEAAATALTLLLERADAERGRAPPLDLAKANVWAKMFAEVPGYFWDTLTGAEPTERSTPYVDFIAAGYLSIQSKPGLRTWANHVRDAVRRVNARPPWDRFNRYRDQLQPPGVTVVEITLKQYQERLDKAFERQEQDGRADMERARRWLEWCALRSDVKALVEESGKSAREVCRAYRVAMKPRH